MGEQLSFFEEENSTQDYSYLFIVKDGKVINISVEDLFDTSRFQKLQAVAFVASPNFFFSTAKEFKSVDLILGIEDSNVVEAFQDGLEGLLNINKRIEIFQALPDDVKHEIAEDRFSIRYASPGHTVHSKFYLMKGEKETRLMLGSANMTERAFANKKQFEELIVFDNSPLFDLYEQRFRDIQNQTKDFIPSFLRKKVKNGQTRLVDSGVVKELLAEELYQSEKLITLSEEEFEQIQKKPKELEDQKQEAIKFKQSIEALTRKDRKMNRHVLQPKHTMEKKLESLKKVMLSSRKRKQPVTERLFLQYKDHSGLLYTSQYSHSNDSEEIPLVIYAKLLESKEELQQCLSILNDFVQGYEKFTANTDRKNQARVFEMILYSFVSVFIWKMRDHYDLEEGRKSVRRYFPPFLIVSGRSMAGKTTALEFIGRLLGNHSPHSYLAYENIKNTSVIWDAFHENNVSPIMVDEIDTKFFTSTAAEKGERLIKYISNELQFHHPALIGTTNASGFDISSQASTRIYYLQSNAFQKELDGSFKPIFE